MGAPLFRVTDHVCKACFGRILERELPDGTVVSRCADCEARADGPASAICACGALPKGFRTRLVCIKNPRPREEAPSEIVVAEAAAP